MIWEVDEVTLNLLPPSLLISLVVSSYSSIFLVSSLSTCSDYCPLASSDNKLEITCTSSDDSTSSGNVVTTRAYNFN